MKLIFLLVAMLPGLNKPKGAKPGSGNAGGTITRADPFNRSVLQLTGSADASANMASVMSSEACDDARVIIMSSGR